MKPTERISQAREANYERYRYEDIDTQKIATLLNLVWELAQILDEQDGKIETLRNQINNLNRITS